MARLEHRILSAFAVPLLTACFVGDGADGLPCEQDADCGLGVSCSLDEASGDRCCGGECLVSQTTMITSSTTSTSTSVGTTTTTSIEPSSSDTSATESSTGSSCGNGVLDPGEECDDDNPNCEDCLFAQPCGNGALDPGEGELCDPWMLPEGEACSDSCQTWTAFAWDDDASEGDTTRDFPVVPCPTEDPSCIDWRSDPLGPRESGFYFPPRRVPSVTRWPEAILLTRAISFPELGPGDTVTVSVRHGYAFNWDSFDGDTSADHGIIAMVPEGQVEEPGSWIRVLPLSGSTDAIPIECDAPQNQCMTSAVPFCTEENERAFAREREMGTDSFSFPGDQVSGGTYYLAFRARYDCGNFDPVPPGDDDAWRIVSASITVER